jgi:predicted nucleic acid-binding protein
VIRVFVDTGAWFAVQATDDEYHQEACDALRSLVTSKLVLVTTNHIVGETYTLLRTARGYRAAATFLETLDATERLERIYVGEDVEKRAFALLHRYHDHDFSFVDGTSFALMKTERIRYAFAFDGRFATAGFLRVPQDVAPERLGA